MTDKKFLLLFNAGDEPITFTIPEALGSAGGSATDWEIVIDTESPRGEPRDAIGFPAKTKVEVASHAIVVLRSRTWRPRWARVAQRPARSDPPAECTPRFLLLSSAMSGVRYDLAGAHDLS